MTKSAAVRNGVLFFINCLIFFASPSYAGRRIEFPPGAPGISLGWAPAQKEAIGTAYQGSPIWFTISQGILTEVFYPTVDRPQIRDLQILVADGNGFFSEQKRDVLSQVEWSATNPSVRIVGQDTRGAYALEQTVITDPKTTSVRLHTRLQLFRPGLKVFVLWKPAIDNSGAGDWGIARDSVLLATQTGTGIVAALASSLPFRKTSAGFVGNSDGWQQLSKFFDLRSLYPIAGPGDVALTAEIEQPRKRGMLEFELTLAFGATEQDTLRTLSETQHSPFTEALTSYVNGWRRYLSGLQLPLIGNDLARSALVIKMHEDKLHPGAIVASMTTPGIPNATEALDSNLGGYHLVWPRDLAHAASGLLAVGDITTAQNIFRFLISRQKPDGSWWQNFWMNGLPYWKAVQMDQVAFPILLAEELTEHGITIRDTELAAIDRAARFLYDHGPVTEQDRWEEIGGYIPSSIAAQIAGLRAAGKLLGSQQYTRTAAFWSQNVEAWTLSRNNPFFGGNSVFLRVSFSGHPSVPERFEIANGGGTALTTEMLDGGFLELTRLGVLPFNHPGILSTLGVYDHETGRLEHEGLFRRYHRDVYGPDHVGGFWPVLGGERGEAALLAGDRGLALRQLSALERAANDNGLIPEQVIGFRAGRPRIGLGVPTPLVWSHAEHLRLARKLHPLK